MRPGPVWQRNRIMRDEFGCMHPAHSHEQMMYAGRLPYRPGGEDDTQEHGLYQLSQPTDFPYFDPSGIGHAPYHPMMPYDPRRGIGGPSGSFSQPVHMMYPMWSSERGGRPGQFRPVSEVLDPPTERVSYDEENEMGDPPKVKGFVSVPAVTAVLLRKMGGGGRVEVDTCTVVSLFILCISPPPRRRLIPPSKY